MVREEIQGITFDQFKTLAKLAGWEAEDLAEMLPSVTRGAMYSEPSLQFFRRVLKSDPDGETIIPYRTVIEKYLTEVGNQVAAGKVRLCQHCGSIIPKGKHKAWPDCPASN